LKFTNSNQYISLLGLRLFPDIQNSEIFYKNSFTVSMWIKLDQAPTTINAYLTRAVSLDVKNI